MAPQLSDGKKLIVTNRFIVCINDKHFHFLFIGLRSVKRELLVSLNKCKKDICKQVLKEYEIGKLDINGIDYDQVFIVINSFQEHFSHSKITKLFSISFYCRSCSTQIIKKNSIVSNNIYL